MTTQQILDERYGRTRSARSRRIVGIAVGVAATISAAALAWSVWSAASDDVDADTTGYSIVDDHRITVTFQIVPPTGRDVACALEAQDAEHGIVGWKVVEVPAADAAARAFTEEIPTVALADTGLVNSCWVI